MYLNFYWIQKYKWSKLNAGKNVRFSSKRDLFFKRSTLTARIFGSRVSSETYYTSF